MDLNFVESSSSSSTIFRVKFRTSVKKKRKKSSIKFDSSSSFEFFNQIEFKLDSVTT